MNNKLQQRRQQVHDMAQNICDALRKEVRDSGLSIDNFDPDINRAEYTLSKDPASSEESLIGVWRDKKGGKQGEILFHSDGSFYAEYDVIREHPTKSKWFIEAAIAWGRDNMLKSELRLLPSVNWETPEQT